MAESSSNSKKARGIQIWSPEHNECLIREMFLFEPWTCKYGSKQRGQVWQRISESLNDLDEPKFNVNQKSVRDHYNVLEREYKKRMRNEEKSSGINPDQSDFDNALEDIIERFKNREECDRQELDDKKEKAEEETAKAVEMRENAMKTFSRKRKSDDGDKKGAYKKVGASETIAYLKYKAEFDAEIRKEELQLRKEELEVQKKQQDQVLQLMQTQNAALVGVIQSISNKKD